MPHGWLGRAAALLPAAAVVAVLAPFANVDPADGFTFSNSPFTDEAWWLANARNFAHFGQWSTDEWNLHLVSPVYSALQATALITSGVDMVAARLVVILAVGLTCTVLALGLRDTFGTTPAWIAAAAYGFSALVLYYGRLAYLEPVVGLGLVTGALLVARAESRRPWLWGVCAGGLMALAIGVKPTAIPLVVGMLGVLLVVDGRASPWTRRWVTGAGVSVVSAAVVWTLFVILPQREAVVIVGRILAEVTLPEDPGQLLYRVLAYPLSNDRALLYSLPLLVGGAAGVALAWPRRDTMPPAARRMIILAAGWMLIGLVVLMVIPYRPNRYFLPLLPALAVLTAAALSLWSRQAVDRLRPARTGLLLAAASIALVLPGLLVHAAWMWNGTRQLAALQQQVTEILPAGAVVEGAYAPLWAFPAPAVAIVSRPESNVNAGDLYASQGVRWVVVEEGEPPAWTASHLAVWAARQVVLCQHWGRVELCLVSLP
jgi:4-amino-4-deoxy-L-arabinose transferase-like glycosyltransferase